VGHPAGGFAGAGPDGKTFADRRHHPTISSKNEGPRRIWLVPVDGGEPRPLTAPELSSAEPAFSPDGKQLAFTRKNEKGKPQLHILPLEGGEARRVTDLPLGVFDPKWLPDGSGIVFASQLIKGHFTPEATAAEIERRDKDPVKAHVTEERVFRFWDTWLTTGETPHSFLFDLAHRRRCAISRPTRPLVRLDGPVRSVRHRTDGRELAFSGIFFDADRSLLRAWIFTVPVQGGPLTCLTADHPDDDVSHATRPTARRSSTACSTIPILRRPRATDGVRPRHTSAQVTRGQLARSRRRTSRSARTARSTSRRRSRRGSRSSPGRTRASRSGSCAAAWSRARARRRAAVLLAAAPESAGETHVAGPDGPGRAAAHHLHRRGALALRAR
jgi:dipeptidyl aminopeptidase/acylaminoacyl peptidase